MLPGAFVLTAIPLNILNAIIISNILNPVISLEEDNIIEVAKEERRSFSSPS